MTDTTVLNSNPISVPGSQPVTQVKVHPIEKLNRQDTVNNIKKIVNALKNFDTKSTDDGLTALQKKLNQAFNSYDKLNKEVEENLTKLSTADKMVDDFNKRIDAKQALLKEFDGIISGISLGIAELDTNKDSALDENFIVNQA